MSGDTEDPVVTPGPLFYDRSGVPIDLGEWQRLRDDPRYRLLGRDRVGHFEVVTVWLGIDQGPLGDETRPLVFGTVARDLDRDSEVLEDREWFARTEEQALRNHAALVSRLS